MLWLALAFHACTSKTRLACTRTRKQPTMPRKGSGEEGVKSKQRSKSDKARRSFELNGTYSSKHLRLRAAEAEAKARPLLEAPARPPKLKKQRST